MHVLYVNLNYLDLLHLHTICEFELFMFAQFVDIISRILSAARIYLSAAKKMEYVFLLRFTFQVNNYIEKLRVFSCITHVYFFYFQCKLWYT